MSLFAKQTAAADPGPGGRGAASEAEERAARYPVVLTIAGADSGGGAGVQADMKTITALGGFATAVHAALTAQNGAGVLGIHEIPVDFVLLQLKAVREGFPVKAAKTGMLASASIIEALADALFGRDFPLVVDPVCVSQSGFRLLHEDAEDAVRRIMLPLADVITPNRPEAELLAGMPIADLADVKKALTRLHAMGARAVLLKGGHFDGGGETMVDWLSMPGESPLALEHARIKTGNNHGTGCTLSAAIATFLARGCAVTDAVQRAQAYLTRALATSFNPGIGAGPPNFLEGAAHVVPLFS